MQLPIEPMLATSADTPPVGDEWRFQLKWDGIRAIVAVERSRVLVWSRHGTNLTSSFPELQALADEVQDGGVLDGELVVCDEHARPDFRKVRRRMSLTRPERIEVAARSLPATFIAFDVLAHGSERITDIGWSERQRTLKQLLPVQGRGWLINPSYEDGRALWEATREEGHEGVVAKRVAAVYRSGRRSNSWVKSKHLARTALPVVGVRDDAVLVADATTLRPIAWIARFHPSVSRGSLAPTCPGRERRPVAFCVVQHLAAKSGGLREPLVLAIRLAG